MFLSFILKDLLDGPKSIFLIRYLVHRETTSIQSKPIQLNLRIYGIPPSGPENVSYWHGVNAVYLYYLYLFKIINLPLYVQLIVNHSIYQFILKIQ